MRKKLTKKQQRATIAHEYRDSDGYWIELLPGWQNGYDPGTHGIVEDTKTAAYSTLTGVEGMISRGRSSGANQPNSKDSSDVTGTAPSGHSA